MKLDLNFLLQPPNFSTRALLAIDALAPLSLVTSMPGAYYRSQPTPTEEMLYGLLENALGLHCSENYISSEEQRQQIIKNVQKLINKARKKIGEESIDIKETKVGFRSLLQFHLRFAACSLPPVMHFDDYWSRQVRNSAFHGSRGNHDRRVIKLMNAIADKDQKITVGDKKEFVNDPNLITNFKKGDKVHLNVLRPYFPRYFTTPTKREYVLPQGTYKYRVETSLQLAQLIAEAIEDPAAPLYLGSNDGWVDVRWEIL